MNKEFEEHFRKDECFKKKILNKTSWQRIETLFFEFFIYIIKSRTTNKILDAICVFVELCQMMAFPLHPRFSPLWRYDKLFNPLSQYLQFFLIAPIFKGSGDLYFIVLYLIVLLVIGNITIFIYASFLISKNDFSQSWPFSIMSFLLSLFGNVLFLPLLQILLSILYCDEDDKSIYSYNYQCWQGWYFLHTSISLICIVILVGLSLFYVSVCFDIRQNTLTNSSKHSTYPDVCLILLKIFLSVVNTILNGKGYNIYLVALSFILSLYVSYLFWYMSPYYSKVLTQLYYISTFCFSWGFGILLFTLIIGDLNFNGGIPLLLIGIVILNITILFSGNTVDYRLFQDIHSGEEYRNMLVDLEIICDIGDSERKYNLILYAYIQKFEDSCITPNCFLKQYLLKKQKTLLYYHLESLYQQGIALYPNCISIRLAYVMMLIDKMKKIRKAQGELNKFSDFPTKKINDSFSLFYLNKIIELSLQEGTNKKERESDLTFIQYKSLVISFKSLINKVASHYLEFWNLLLISKNEFQEDLTKLNDLGSKINSLLEEIDFKLSALQKIKKNDQEIIRLYSDFLGCILNNKEKAKEFYHKLINGSNNTEIASNEVIDDKDLLEENFLLLISKKDKMYIVLSTQSESFGHIIHISLGLTSRLGYLNEELIGHSINLIIPEIFTKYHQLILKDTFNTLKSTMIIIDQNNPLKTVQNNKTIKVFALTKSKYIIPIAFSVVFIQNENGYYYFIAKLIPEYFDMTSYETSEESCYVLTDALFHIKNYTSNAIRLLGLSSIEMNGLFDITNSIKEFNEQHLKNMTNKFYNEKSNNHHHHNDDDNELDYNDMKNQLLNTFIGKETTITWKHYIPTTILQGAIGGSILVANESNISNKIPDINMFLNSNMKSYSGDLSMNKRKEQTFIISVTEQKISKHIVGFAFKFDINTMMILNKKRIKKSSLCNSFQSEKIRKTNRKNSIVQPAFVGEKRVQLLNSINNNNSFISINEIENADNFFHQKTKSTVEQRISTTLGHKINIDKTYIPKNTLKFVLNPDKNLYRQYNSNDKSHNVTELVRNKAIDYLNENQFEENYIITTEEEEESDDNNSHSNSNSNSNSSNDIESVENEIVKKPIGNSFSENYCSKKKSSHMLVNFNNSFCSKTKDSNNNIEYWNDYYHVNLQNIRFTIYDFIKKIPIELHSSEGNLPKSEVDKKLHQDIYSLDHEGEIKSTFVKDMKIAQESSMHQNIKKQSRNTKISSTILGHVTNRECNENKNKRSILLRQIEISLNKKETPFTIILFQILSLISLIILLLETGLVLSICLNNQTNVIVILSLLTKSGEMIIDIIGSIYFAREITLINVDNYTNIYTNDREAYLTNCSKSLYELFDDYSLLQSILSTSSNTLSDPNFMILFNKTIILKTITPEYDAEFFTGSIYSSFILHQMAHFRISQSNPKTLIPSQNDIYFFLYNSNNVNILNHGLQTQVFFGQIINIFGKHKILLSVIIVIMFILHVLIFLGMRNLYRKVTEKKVSYLEVFLEIGNIIISQMYEKCDVFLTKIQLKNNLVNSKYSNDDFSTTLFDEDNDVNDYSMKNNSNLQSEYRHKHNSNSNNTKSNKIASETRKVTLFFSMTMLCTYFMTLGIIIFYWIFIANIKVMTQLYQTQLTIEIMTLMGFNLIREFIFDNYAEIYGKPAYSYIDYMIKNYTTIIKDLQGNFERDMVILSSTFQEDYLKIQKQNICEYSFDFFPTHQPNSTCSDFTSKAATFGLKNTINFYFEEIRFLYYHNARYWARFDLNVFTYNYTLLKTEKGNSYWPKSNWHKLIYQLSMPIQLFDENTHLHLAFMHRFLLKPIFKDLMNKLYSAISEEIIIVRQILIFGSTTYFIILILFYIIIWKPFEIKLNSTIYKTKRMLSIIPREVLVSINNIHILLELDSRAITDNII